MYTSPSDSSVVTTVGEWSCRSCHQSHGGKGVPYLLTKTEEQTCFVSGCHGTTGTGTDTKNIESEFTKLYAHPTVTTAGKHRNPDDASSLGIDARHAECQDCHNSHQSKQGLHAVKSNAVSGVLQGVRGVIPQYTDNWTQPTTFLEANPSTQESQICFKCHSYNAFGPLADGVSAVIGPSGEKITDQAMEFSPKNRSAHPVQFSLNQQEGAVLPLALTANQMNSTWSDNGTQTMYCSDCHGNNQPTSQTVPQGPHASDARFMLTGQAKYWPMNATGTLWSLADLSNNTNNWQNDLFCVNCHPLNQAGSFANNVHSALQHQDATIKCVTCHVTVPHGSKRSRLIGYDTDVQPYNYGGVGQYDKLVIQGFEKTSPLLYAKSNCTMNGVCHGTQIGTYEP